LGNGRLGAMIFGGVHADRIALNEESLYAGGPLPQGKLPIKERLAGVVELLEEGRYDEADAEVSRHFLGRGQECYQTLGDLYLEFDGESEPGAYLRELDLQTAKAAVSYEDAAGRHERDYFTSIPADVLVVRLSTKRAGGLTVTISLRSPHPHAVETNVSGQELHLSGRLPGFCLRRSWDWIADRGDEWKYPEVYDESGHLRPGAKPVLYGEASGDRGMRFHCGLNVRLPDGGTVSETGNALVVRNAKEVVIVLAAASSYSRFDRAPTEDAAARVREKIAKVSDKSFTELRDEHEQAYGQLFDRVSFSLGCGSREEIFYPADSHLDTPDQQQHLVETVFQFGRYLLISASHPQCRHPANLQGIWNEEITPPWASAYTTNINLQMNYWLAGPANLEECVEPLVRLLEECAENGARTASGSYGLDGWVLHHNTDVWRKTDPVDFTARTAFWPMGSGWLCCHLWEHYLFTGDTAFLRERAWPLMKGAATFYLGWLVENKDGWLVTPISTSPENQFHASNGRTASVSAGCTMDMSILRELFGNCAQAARLCGDVAFGEKLAEVLPRLLPLQIGRLGQLQEWADDWDDPTDHHRHFSHLFGVFPGTQITMETAKTRHGALKSLELRGDGGTGWSQAWKTSVYARLGEPELAWKSLLALLQPMERGTLLADALYDKGQSLCGLYPNLFAACPPFQIDANFGLVAAVCEILLQSHEDFIRLLPALPADWSRGAIRGLRARSGLEVALAWEEGRLSHASVRALRPGTYRLHYRGCTVPVSLAAGAEVTLREKDFV